MRLRLSAWLYKTACQLNPGIPIAIEQWAQQRATELANQALSQHAAQQALEWHQQQAAARAARQ